MYKKKYNLHFGKKAMMDDFFDFLFTVIAAVFLFYFLTFTLNQGVKESDNQALDELSTFRRLDSGVNNLRLQLYEGQSLTPKEIGVKIEKSKILGGKVITGCADYFTKADCEKDSVAIHEDDDNNKCIWKESSKNCYTLHVSMAGG